LELNLTNDAKIDIKINVEYVAIILSLIGFKGTSMLDEQMIRDVGDAFGQ